MYSIADKFDVTESSVLVCVNRVVKFLHAIRDEVICWRSSAEVVHVKAGFLAKSGLKGPRNTIGCIDGCHVEILKPDQSAHSYNRKKFPSSYRQSATIRVNSRTCSSVFRGRHTMRVC